jgi:acetyl-CoA carboxylase carboxyl transferase subunit alpha
MNLNFLDFEQPIAELEAKIDELRFVGDDSQVNISSEIRRLKSKSDALTRSIFSNLTAWQVAQVARHPAAPYTLDYIERLFTDFEELHGDRTYATTRPSSAAGAFRGPAGGDRRPAEGPRHQGQGAPQLRHAAAGGLSQGAAADAAGREIRPAGDHLIDTPGAYPGIGAEERGQSEAIARNLLEMSGLKTPIIAVVIGEGGSGGALAIGVADHVLMLQYSIYSVISPEGCASILWKSAEKSAEAAEAMGITAAKLHELGLVDEVIQEPLGGAHRDADAMAESCAPRSPATSAGWTTCRSTSC